MALSPQILIDRSMLGWQCQLLGFCRVESRYPAWQMAYSRLNPLGSVFPVGYVFRKMVFTLVAGRVVTFLCVCVSGEWMGRLETSKGDNLWLGFSISAGYCNPPGFIMDRGERV